MSESEAVAKIADGGAVSALANLARLKTSNVSGVVLVRQPSPGAAVVSQSQTTGKAGSSLSLIARQAVSLYSDMEVIEYHPSGQAADGEVMWLPTSTVPFIEQVASDMADLANLPVFDPSEQRLTDLSLTAMRVEGEGTSAVFIQAVRSNQVVVQARRVGLIVRAGVLDVPDGDMLLLSPDMTAVVTTGYVFFRDRKSFQRLTGLIQVLQEQASATFEAVTENLRIDGLREMALAVTKGPQMLGKMASIQEKLNKYPTYKKAMTMARLIPFVAAHPECGVEIKGEGDEAQFVFHNDSQRRFKLLKLLDDDYLQSQLTNFEYEANSKSRPIGGTAG